MLIKPIQRVCKYPLLLRELLKNTAVGTKDWMLLIEAQSKIESVVDDINTSKKRYEYQNSMMEIASAIVFPKGMERIPLIAPTRTISKLGQLAQCKLGSTLHANANENVQRQ